MSNETTYLISYLVSLVIIGTVQLPYGPVVGFALIIYGSTVYIGHILKSK